MAKSKIIKELANNDISLDVALSRLLIIAYDLDNEELALWAENELNGYKKDDAVPNYRIIHSSHFLYSGINGSFQVNSQPLPIEQFLPDIDEGIFSVCMKGGIATIEQSINGGDEHTFVRDFTVLAGKIKKVSGIICTKIIQDIPTNEVQNILCCLKTTLMKIFIKLDKTYGCLDDMDIETSNYDADLVKQTNAIINNYIYVNNSISIGDRNKIDGSNIAVGGKE